jgi:hypothetical protein
MGTVEDWPVSVSILTQYGDSFCCVSGVMRYPRFWNDESGRDKNLKDSSSFSSKARWRLTFEFRFPLGLRCDPVLGRMTFSCEPFYILRGNAIDVLMKLQTKTVRMLLDHCFEKTIETTSAVRTD